MQRKHKPLETIRIGGRRYTSQEAISRFIAGCNEPGTIRDGGAEDARQRRVAAAMFQLKADGVVK